MSNHRFYCIDGHTCGNPVRLIAEGGPELFGASMAEKRLYFMEHYDWIRKGLMFEPRGHDMMSGSILYPPSNPENDFAILFVETSGCLPMCGHGTIGTVTMGLQEGLIKPKRPGFLKMEAPAGLVEIEYKEKDGKIVWVKLTNVASYLAGEGLEVYSPKLDVNLSFDVAYGGNFYAIFDPQEQFKGLENYSASELISWSQELRPLINEKYSNKFVHPYKSEIKDVSHVMWTGSPLDTKSSGRNAVFYGDKAIDRSPCGTGTSARLAQLYGKGLLGLNELYTHESIIGSTFEAQIEGFTNLGSFEAIIPSVKGWAKQFGYNTIHIDTEDDPFAYGFQVI